MSRLNATSLRNARAAILADVTVALASASEGPTEEYVLFRTPGGVTRIPRQRERLERFAAAVQRCDGYRATSKPAPLRRLREDWRAMRPTEDVRFERFTADALQKKLRDLKAGVMERMLGAWRGTHHYPPEWRVSDAQEIDAVQRELVRRGLLDATDYDKVTAEPIHEELPEASAEQPTVPRIATPRRKRGRCNPEAVEVVEAIETRDGRLALAVFDADFDLLGLYTGFETRIRTPQDLREALAIPAAGTDPDWPPSSTRTQTVYDRLTAKASEYTVIGRWWRDRGLDLRELRLSRLLSRGPRHLAPPMAA